MRQNPRSVKGLEASLDGSTSWSEPYDWTVTPAAVARYAAAVGAAQRAWADGDATPPLFAVVPARQAVMQALRQAVAAEVSARVPVLHGEDRLAVTAGLRVGETVVCQSRLESVAWRSSGTTVTSVIRVRGADGSPRTIERMTAFVPTEHVGEPFGEPPPPLPADDDLDTADGCDAVTDPDMSLRYAEAADDRSRFHVDDRAARAAGFDGVIMHGLCTLAVALPCVFGALGSDGTGSFELGVRFGAPMLPGAALHTQVAVDGDCARFRATSGGGAVLRRGVLWLTPSGKAAA